ncbi:MAG: D-2-hydroxyacid dehydrogenase [Oscillospiraceae bacterium]|nr:D-2-hydroxyacid dehydrogenase [Oscillospiraceae bacterium]
MKIAILDKCTVTKGDVSLSEISSLGETVFYDVVPDDEIAGAIGDADAVICNKARITAEVMSKCKNLKYVGLFATGYNNIDIAYAREHGICVCNVPGYSTNAVAQMTFSFILALSGSLCDYTNSTREGGWIKSSTFSYFPFPIFELAGKTLGIFGFGNIGREVAKIGEAFHMNILVSTRTPSKCTEYECVGVEELFERADFLTLHAPLTPETERVVNEKTLSLMKSSAYLINTSRGGAVDERALARALNEERLAGAGIDVLTCEPMEKENPLRLAKNCLITPHIGWAPIETRRRLMTLVAENISAWMGGNPKNVVSK